MAFVLSMLLKKYSPWIVGVVAVAGLVLINTDVFSPKTKEEQSSDTPSDESKVIPPAWVADLELWKEQNKEALSKYFSEGGGREEGGRMLAEMLRWNWSTEFGVNFAGVDVNEIFSLVTVPDSGSSLLEYLGSSSPRSGSFLVSFAKSNLEGAGFPDVDIRGISFAGAKASTSTWEKWMKMRGGRGMEGCNLSGVDLSGVNIHGVVLKGADLDNTGIRPDFSDNLPSKFDNTNLGGVSFEGRNLTGVSLRYCNLSRASISADQLLEVARSFGGSGLRGAILPSSDFVNKDVNGLTMQFADLGAVKLSEDQIKSIASQWSGMGLYGAKLPGASR